MKYMTMCNEIINKKPMISLAFVEYSQDVKYLFKKGIYKEAGLKILALGPEALLELERLNIPYNALDNLIEKKEYNNLIYDSSIEFESIYPFLLENLQNLNDAEKLLGSFEGILKQLCANIMIKSRCLKKLLAIYNPSRVSFFQLKIPCQMITIFTILNLIIH